MSSKKKPNFFEKVAIQTKIVAIDTEVSVLTDQVIALRQTYGVDSFAFMADPEKNEEALKKIYSNVMEKIKPRQNKIDAKLDEKRALQAKLKPERVAC